MPASTVEEALKKYTKSKEIFSAAQMKLRDFISNNSEVNSKFEEEDQLKQTFNSPLTKRQVLHIIASIYDPMGWLAPMLVPAKAFLQQLWAEKVSWDVELSQKTRREWSSITEEWENTALTVPRRIGIAEDEDYTLHCFVDASKTAFAAAVYYLASGGNHPHLFFFKIESPLPSQSLSLGLS
uniref:Reverse transcriptase/retrotransposon-derived protein RNase H-like domain-containing protein n=1 Tax=Ditylenchus dipsaci TaxID=166011 RepID=A0A915EGZ8_9BILA